MSRMSLLLGLLLLFSSAMVWGQTTYPPVFHVTMDEHSGNMVYDISGNGNHGTVYGTLVESTCINLARLFSGPGDTIIVANNDKINFAGDFTITAFVRLDDYRDDGKIVFKSPGLDVTAHYQIAIGAGDGTFSFQLASPSGPDILKSDIKVPIGECTFLVAMRESSQMRIYVNGQLAGSKDCTNADQTNSADLYIGNHPFIGNQYFPGVIDDVRMYDYALTIGEIESLFDLGSCICETGDANGDSDVNVGDAVYLINYTFRGGPPPVPYYCE